MSVRVYRRMLAMIMMLVLCVCGGYFLLKWQEEQLEATAVTKGIENNYVIPGGMPIGIYLETNGILVLGTETIEDNQGTKISPAKNLVKSGDYIVGIDDVNIDDKKDLIEAVKNLEGNSAVLHLRREKEKFNIKIKPAQNQKGDYKLGIWVRDNAQGLGTITYIDLHHRFGALGHGIHDMDTNKLLQISDGTLYETNIQNIKKGMTGSPGGLEGTILYSNYNIIGNIDSNNECGLYGTINKLDTIYQNTEPVPIVRNEDVKIGEAYIQSAVSGKLEKYHIKITGIDYHPKEINKALQLKVDDQRLLDMTGGIVQGMSGSPVIQNGRIVGAVTHVLVNDPTRGYGIFIENMLEAME